MEGIGSDGICDLISYVRLVCNVVSRRRGRMNDLDRGSVCGMRYAFSINGLYKYNDLRPTSSSQPDNTQI